MERNRTFEEELENLLDSIERFFKETMYRRALDKDFEGM